MLQLKNITKVYTVGGEEIQALKDVSLRFHRSEFVSILGPSGCGKTTMLNIIGGLDGYTSGDLLIRGRSTKKFKDADWDAYRNHSIGFVFQSYNLIPHQSALANVELALTISGVSRAQRRARAVEALKKVGLETQLHKKPSQMSGGQMQRVAIARSLVNDPEILLADEPTGALDSENSVQIMEILKQISHDRLVIMVTHNPELAQQYSSRIIRLLDGQVQSDSNPCLDDAPAVFPEKQEKKKPSMSFLTALSLSCNNLLTKKARTILTAFAGSIGIIGIALILSLSTGIQNYIDQVQKDTLSSYPITIEAETVDLSSMVSTFMSTGQGGDHARDAVYASPVMYNLMDSMLNIETDTNNLSAFRDYLEAEGSPVREYASVIQYSYDIPFDVYTRDENGELVHCDISAIMQDMMHAMGNSITSETMQSNMMAGNMKVWEEMLPGTDGELISPMLDDQYELVSGSWPQAYNEVVLIVNSQNEISDLVLYALGLKPAKELDELVTAFLHGDELTDTMQTWSYEQVLGQRFKLILPSEHYSFDAASAAYTDLSESETGMEFLYDSTSTGTELKIVGIVRESDDAVSNMLSGAIGYTKALTDYMIEKTAGQEIVARQLADTQTDVITALPFRSDADGEIALAEKQEAVTAYLAGLDMDEKASLYRELAAHPSDAYVASAVEQSMAGLDRAYIESQLVTQYAAQMGVEESAIAEYIASMDDETLFGYIRQSLEEQVREQYGVQARAGLMNMEPAQLAAALDSTALDDEQYIYIYDVCMPPQYSDASYEQRLTQLGYADLEIPSRISIYTDTFENKDAIADQIAAYNASAEEEDQISYTDYIALLMSSITTIINVISYVLIAFVAISLVVSSIMIGIITYISVLERTKEIGILRAIGASKRDVSRVFNAETLIVGLTAGAIGIGVTMLLNLPISRIVQSLSGISNIAAVLPAGAAVILVLISMFLTLIAGLIPAKIASRKDPVVALRTE